MIRYGTAEQNSFLLSTNPQLITQQVIPDDVTLLLSIVWAGLTHITLPYSHGRLRLPSGHTGFNWTLPTQLFFIPWFVFQPEAGVAPPRRRLSSL